MKLVELGPFDMYPFTFKPVCLNFQAVTHSNFKGNIAITEMGYIEFINRPI